MLFKYENNIPIQCTLVDFQLLRHFHPGYDAILLLYSNTTRNFRKSYKSKLLDYYYNVFSKILEKNGLVLDDFLKKDDFLLTVRHFEPVALTQAACTRTLVMMPKELTKGAVDSTENFEMIMFKEERVNFFVEAFKRDKHFQSTITDDIEDLDELF